MVAGKGAREGLVALDTELNDAGARVRIAAAFGFWGIVRDLETSKSVLLRGLRSKSARVPEMATPFTPNRSPMRSGQVPR